MTELNQVKEVSNRCICSDLAATHPVICEANHYCFRFEHADIDMSDIGVPVMVAPLTLGSSNGHARCLEKPFCESVDGSAKNTFDCLCGNLNSQGNEICNSGEYCFSGVSPNEIYVSYCSIKYYVSEILW